MIIQAMKDWNFEVVTKKHIENPKESNTGKYHKNVNIRKE
jgi:hypothetical protein